MTFSYTHDCPNSKIGIIPNTRIMYYTLGCWAYCFTENLEPAYHDSMRIDDLNNMELLSYRFRNITYLCTNNDHDISQYKFITIQHQNNENLSCKTNMIIKTYTHHTLKSYEKYHETFHKYKFLHNTLCLDIVNIIFQLITYIEINDHHYIKINKMYISFTDDKFKHKLMNIIRDTVCSNI